MLKVILTLFFAFVGVESVLTPTVGAPNGVLKSVQHYSCTSTSGEDYYSYKKFQFPSWWFRVSHRGECKYTCEPYKIYGDYKVGFSATCGALNKTKLIEHGDLENDPKDLKIPAYLRQKVGTFRSFKGKQEFTLCVYPKEYKPTCGYHEPFVLPNQPKPIVPFQFKKANTNIKLINLTNVKETQTESNVKETHTESNTTLKKLQLPISKQIRLERKEKSLKRYIAQLMNSKTQNITKIAMAQIQLIKMQMHKKILTIKQEKAKEKAKEKQLKSYIKKLIDKYNAKDLNKTTKKILLEKINQTKIILAKSISKNKAKNGVKNVTRVLKNNVKKDVKTAGVKKALKVSKNNAKNSIKNVTRLLKNNVKKDVKTAVVKNVKKVSKNNVKNSVKNVTRVSKNNAKKAVRVSKNNAKNGVKNGVKNITKLSKNNIKTAGVVSKNSVKNGLKNSQKKSIEKRKLVLLKQKLQKLLQKEPGNKKIIQQLRQIRNNKINNKKIELLKHTNPEASIKQQKEMRNDLKLLLEKKYNETKSPVIKKLLDKISSGKISLDNVGKRDKIIVNKPKTKPKSNPKTNPKSNPKSKKIIDKKKEDIRSQSFKEYFKLRVKHANLLNDFNKKIKTKTMTVLEQSNFQKELYEIQTRMSRVKQMLKI